MQVFCAYENDPALWDSDPCGDNPIIGGLILTGSDLYRITPRISGQGARVASDLVRLHALVMRQFGLHLLVSPL